MCTAVCVYPHPQAPPKKGEGPCHTIVSFQDPTLSGELLICAESAYDVTAHALPDITL